MKWMSLFVAVGVLWAQDSTEQFNKAKELLEHDPSAALEFATKAAASNGLTQRWFWPLMLDAQVRLGKWPEAIESGAKSVESIETGIMFTRFDQIPDEIKLRRLYASALGHVGKSEAAGVQLDIVLALEGGKSNPVASKEHASRLKYAKIDLLAAEVNIPVEREFVGDSFKKRTVVVALWAAWCAPCIKELDALNALYPQLRDRAEVRAINIDGSAPPHPYLFPMVTVKDLVSTIPQLYVIDREGNVRFHIKGFDDDGIFEQRIDWMVEAAARHH